MRQVVELLSEIASLNRKVSHLSPGPEVMSLAASSCSLDSSDDRDAESLDYLKQQTGFQKMP
jgi:hypothetical protein